MDSCRALVWPIMDYTAYKRVQNVRPTPFSLSFPHFISPFPPILLNFFYHLLKVENICAIIPNICHVFKRTPSVYICLILVLLYWCYYLINNTRTKGGGCQVLPDDIQAHPFIAHQHGRAGTRHYYYSHRHLFSPSMYSYLELVQNNSALLSRKGCSLFDC